MSVYPGPRPWWQDESREDLGGAGGMNAADPASVIRRLLARLRGGNTGRLPDDSVEWLIKQLTQGRGALPGANAVPADPMEQDVVKAYMKSRMGGDNLGGYFRGTPF